MSESFKDWAKETKNKKYVIAIGLLIILVVVLAFIPLDNKPQKVTNAVTQLTAKAEPEEDYESQLERKLANMLAKMDGVGSVSVMVTLESGSEKVLADNVSTNTQKQEEKDQSGGTRVTESNQEKSDVVMQSGNVPYVIKEYKPQIKGVFIIASGAGNSAVKTQITEAVARVLDIPVHKISVEKKRS